MRFEVLGKSPAWTDSGGACSGYIVQEGATTLLLDCGNGVFGKLRERMDPFGVDAVVLTHLHADHVVDILPFAYALLYSPQDVRPGRRTLHVPPGAHDRLRAMIGSWGPEQLLDWAFDVREYDPGGVLAIGDLALRFCEVPHFTRTWAVDLRAAGAAAPRLVFGADCAPNGALERFARDADLLVVEATLTEPEPDGDRGHLTPAEAGALAARAEARRVVVTHYTDMLDPAWIRDQAAGALGRPVELAVEGAVYEV